MKAYFFYRKEIYSNIRVRLLEKVYDAYVFYMERDYQIRVGVDRRFGTGASIAIDKSC